MRWIAFANRFFIGNSLIFNVIKINFTFKVRASCYNISVLLKLKNINSL